MCLDEREMCVDCDGVCAVCEPVHPHTADCEVCEPVYPHTADLVARYQYRQEGRALERRDIAENLRKLHSVLIHPAGGEFPARIWATTIKKFIETLEGDDYDGQTNN